MQHSRIAVRQVGGVTVAELLDEQIGRLDTEAVNEVSEALSALLPKDRPGRLLVDLGRVEFMGSTLLGTLIRLSKRATENKGSVKLCSLNASIQRIITVAKLGPIMHVYADQQSALDSFAESDSLDEL